MTSITPDRGSIIMAGDGDDLLGYEKPCTWDWINELSILSGGEGADTFYIPVTGTDWINAHEQYDIILDDFNPLEDKIVLNPSRAGKALLEMTYRMTVSLPSLLRILVIMTMR